MIRGLAVALLAAAALTAVSGASSLFSSRASRRFSSVSYSKTSVSKTSPSGLKTISEPCSAVWPTTVRDSVTAPRRNFISLIWLPS